VREIEVAHTRLTGIRRRIQGGTKGKRIRNRKRVALDDILTGLQMPPKIGIGDFGAK